MQAKVLILLALMAVALAEDAVKPTTATVEKKQKRGLWDVGLGYAAPYATYSAGLPAATYYTSGVHTNTNTVITKEVPVAVPHPVAVPVEKHVPYPVIQKVAVPVDRPVAVPYPKPYPVEVTKHVPYAVDRPVPVHIPYPVVKHVPAPYPVRVPQPYAVPVVKHVAVPYAQPVYLEKYSSPVYASSW